MKRTVMVSCLLLGFSCFVVQAQNVSAPKPLWNISAGQLPGDSRNATFSLARGHTADGVGRSLSVTGTGPGWVGEWCGKAVNWTGFERLTFTASNSNDADVSVYVRIKTVAGALVNLSLDLAPGPSTPVLELTDLKDISGEDKPVDLAQVRQWSINWNDAFEKPVYISDLRLESGTVAPARPEAPKPGPAAATVQPAPAVPAVQPASTQVPAPPLPPVAQVSYDHGINWSAVLCVMMVCVTAIIIVAMLRRRKA